MRIGTLPPRTQVLLTILLPVVSLAIAALLVWPYFCNLRRVKKELVQTESTIKEKKQNIQQAEAVAAGRPLALAVVNSTEEEPIRFLKQLAALTADSGASLEAVRALGMAAPPQQENVYGTRPTEPAPGVDSSPGQRPVVPQTIVRELRDEVTVRGPFPNLLALLVRLENYERILSVSKLRMQVGGGSQGYPQLQAVFTLSRFVSIPQPAGTTAATASSAAAR